MDFDYVFIILKIVYKLCNFLNDVNLMCKVREINKLVIIKKLKGFLVFFCYWNLDNNRGYY